MRKKEIIITGENLAAFLDMKLISEVLEESENGNITPEVLGCIIRGKNENTHESVPVLKELILSAKDKRMTLTVDDTNLVFCFKSIDPDEPVVRFENNVYFRIF